MSERKVTQPTRDGNISRRRFIGRSAAAAALTIVPGSALGAKKKKRSKPKPKPPGPADKLNVACIGLGACGLFNLEKCIGHNVVALCDVDWKLSAVALQRFGKAAKYRDFRRMLDREKSIDAVIVATPDHTHAVITAEVMRRKKHVYTEMPLAHDVWEVRRLVKIAKETGVTTQMGNEGHSGPTIRRAVEMVWGGGLGAIREIHCWTNRPRWPQGDLKAKQAAMSDGLAWDLWLGPAPKRSYSPAYHPYRWRGWLDFGTGALGAIGCHVMDGAFWAMKLAEVASFSVDADSTGISPQAYPQASTIRYRFPARGKAPPVTITWYDGGRKPKLPKGFPNVRGLGSGGTIFVGEKHSMTFGAITAGTLAGQAGPRTIPEFQKITPVTSSFKKIPPVRDRYGWRTGSRHVQEWITACRAGKQPCSSFDQAGPLTEMVLLGNVALQAGKKIEWDVEKLKITNAPEANKFIRRKYREGWSL